MDPKFILIFDKISKLCRKTRIARAVTVAYFICEIQKTGFVCANKQVQAEY